MRMLPMIPPIVFTNIAFPTCALALAGVRPGLGEAKHLECAQATPAAATLALSMGQPVAARFRQDENVS